MKSGFVSLIGRPNAGKSTLLNQIMERKIAIVSNKPQTTRHRISGIFTTEEAQIIFVDTPGIHKPKHKLGDYMMKAATSVIYDGDVIFYVVDATSDFGGGEAFIIKALENIQAPVFLLLNKVDEMSHEQILKTIVSWQNRYPFAEIFPLSALKGDNVEDLIATTIKYLPEGPYFYAEDEVTDQPEKVIMAELIREKILRLTKEEIPHSVAVKIEKVSRENGKRHVYALILTERKTQKGILIGKGGSLLKKVGTQAREDIEELLGEKIFLELWVKVKDDWRDSQNILDELGFSESDFE